MTPEQPDVAGEPDYWYQDKLTGQRVAFSPKTGEAVVTLAGTLDRDALPGLLSGPAVRSISRGANLRRGFAAVHVEPGRAVSDLTAQEDVASALPVMIDQDGLERYFLPGEFTVQFRPGVNAATAEAIISRLGSGIVSRQRTPGYYTLLVPRGRGLFATIRQFSDLPEVAFAEPSEAGFDDALAHIPADPDFQLLWGMRNTGQAVNGVAGTAGIDIDAPAAWDLHRGDPAVIVTVIDTGADLDHPDLQANLLPRGGEDWDFADAGDPSRDDVAGHGTHVAGTAAATENAIGVVGVAPRCQIMPLRIDLQAGMNQNRADAINYVAQQAAAHPARRYVINCSWRTSGDHAGVRNAIVNATDANVVVVFAAGNSNRNTDVTPEYPGVYPQVIAAAAIDQDGLRAGFSNFGSNVDVCAPGVNIYSSLPEETYGFLDGTSMAAPHVTGLAALVWSVSQELTNHQVRQIIEDTCVSVDSLNPAFAGLLGRGRINAFRAVELAQFITAYVPSIPALA
jgi:subtilisin family serine protease